ncbi:hypothetical protein GCM10022280_03680 [Sphingomonas swuensis]|uniref:Flagellar protein FliL n=1 Tax=Sphingomonas swuensis TaxID=977800 RepID=A0ABP7SCH2_9SPHN
MSEAATEPEDKEEEAPAEAPPPPGKKKRLILIIAAVVVLALGGGGGWYFLSGGEETETADHEAEEAPEAFVDVPPIQVSMRAADGSSRMLKLHVMLVPGSLTEEELTHRLPQLIDRYQPFLRELRPEDLAGSAATFRVKEELLIRSNQALGVGSVRDVLIQDLMQG